MNWPAVLSRREMVPFATLPNSSTLGPSYIGVQEQAFEDPLGTGTYVPLFRASRVLTNRDAAAPEETEAEWKTAIERQLDELRTLEPGWDTYAAARMDPDVITDAKRLVARLARPGVPPPSVVPTVSGTVQLEWHTRACDAELEILEPNCYHVFTRLVGGQPWEGETTFGEAVYRIEQVVLPD